MVGYQSLMPMASLDRTNPINFVQLLSININFKQHGFWNSKIQV